MTEGLTLALSQLPALLSSGLGAVPDWSYHISPKFSLCATLKPADSLRIWLENFLVVSI
jgi:hypothetical protein